MELALLSQLKTKKFWIIFAICVFLIYEIISWLGNHHKNVHALKVEVSSAREANLAPHFDTSGTIVAKNTADIKSQVTGTLISIPVIPGQEVHANQLLFQIDPRPFEASVNQAKATLLKDQATAANNNSHYDRFLKLVQKGFVSKDDFSQAKANKLAADAQVAVDQAALNSAQLQLAYTKITAPFDGRISDITPHVGDLIIANSTTTSPLTTLNQIKPVDASFSLPSEILGQLVKTPMANIKVIATPDANKSYNAQGQLFFINNQIDPTTGSIAMKASFPNSDEGLWPGEFVKLHLVFPPIPHSIIVPTIAIQQNQDQKYYVYVVNKKHQAHLAFVTLGPTEGTNTAILSGVKKDDLVITKGQFEISDGSAVSI